MFNNTPSSTEVKYFDVKKYPEIIFTPKSLAVMKYIVDSVDDEVGWLGVVESYPDNKFLVTDIYIPNQGVHGATCELMPDGLSTLAEYLIANGKEDDIGKIRLWGHSHVNMGVSPSNQDLSDSMRLANDCGNFFIRVICNKSGLMSVSFYDMINKRWIENIPWCIFDGVDRKEIADTYGPMIKENVKKLDTFNKTVSTVDERQKDAYNDYRYGDKWFEERWHEDKKRTSKKTPVTLKEYHSGHRLSKTD